MFEIDILERLNRLEKKMRDRETLESGGGGGISDHGELSGLADNDHPQYLLAADLLNKTYPIGAIFISVSSTSPATLFGGTWTAFGAGRVLVGRNASDPSFDTVEETGGAKTHTLTTAEMPSHTHTGPSHTHTTPDHQHSFPWANQGGSMGPMPNGYSNQNYGGTAYTYSGGGGTSGAAGTGNTGSAGSGGAHNNLQPYIVVYMWKRTG